MENEIVLALYHVIYVRQTWESGQHVMKGRVANSRGIEAFRRFFRHDRADSGKKVYLAIRDALKYAIDQVFDWFLALFGKHSGGAPRRSIRLSGLAREVSRIRGAKKATPLIQAFLGYCATPKKRRK
jgi:hypothetical protein